MPLYKKTLLIVTLLVLPFASYAADVFGAKLTRVGTTNAGDAIVIETTPNPPSQSGCSASTKMLLPTSNLLFKENVSILLSAIHAQSNVTIYVEGCQGSHIKFLSVSVTD